MFFNVLEFINFFIVTSTSHVAQFKIKSGGGGGRWGEGRWEEGDGREGREGKGEGKEESFFPKRT